MDLHKKKYNLKFTIFSMLFLILLLSIWSISFYKIYREELEGSFRSYSETTAIILSNFIETFPEDYKYIQETYDTNTDFYKKIYNVFYETMNNSEIEYAYTVKWHNENEIKFILVVDNEESENEYNTPIGTTWEMGEYAQKAFETGKTVSSDFTYYKSWGESYLTSFAPIIDTNTNEIIGLVGVDFKINKLKTRLNLLFIRISVAMFFILGVLNIIILLFSNKLVEPYVLDTLTKAYNRKFFYNYFGNLYQKEKKKETPISIIIIDIDHFKKINDTYGHVFGDKVLKEMSQTILKNIEKSDCFSRYGGEEFILSLININEKNAMEIAENIRKIVSNSSIYNKDTGKYVNITISIGVACSSEVNAKDINDLMIKADKALYLAKVNRNTVKSYTDYLNFNSSTETT